MAGAKEIRRQVASVQNAQRITKAMEMVAASGMRRSRNSMAASRPYAETMRKVIGHLATVIWNISTLTWKTATVKHIGCAVMSSRPWFVRWFEH
ncbi:F0F1 ATP synthase subunit gamma [Escherichia coli]